jgi:hypothetical protein
MVIVVTKVRAVKSKPDVFVLPQIYSLMFLSIFFLVSCGGVGLSPLGTSANIWPTVPALVDMMSVE